VPKPVLLWEPAIEAAASNVGEDVSTGRTVDSRPHGSSRRLDRERRVSAMKRSALVALVLLAACGRGSSVDVTATEAAAGRAVANEPRYRGTVLVLEDATGPPRLCQGALDSMPPACGEGIDLAGWSWATVEGETTMIGVTWGSYEVTVTVDGEALSVVAAGAPQPSLPGRSEPDLRTPCAEPDGGWASTVDRSLLALDNFTAFHDYLNAQADRSATWVDSSTDPKFDPNDLGHYVFDEASVVTTIRFTGDAERHEAEIRTIWGGPICIVEGGVPFTRLVEILSEVMRDEGSAGGYVDEVGGQVVVNALLEDPAAQTRLDQRYGPGTVVLNPALLLVEAS
jgi:hypothetical protein